MDISFRIGKESFKDFPIENIKKASNGEDITENVALNILQSQGDDSGLIVEHKANKLIAKINVEVNPGDFITVEAIYKGRVSKSNLASREKEFADAVLNKLRESNGQFKSSNLDNLENVENTKDFKDYKAKYKDNIKQLHQQIKEQIKDLDKKGSKYEELNHCSLQLKQLSEDLKSAKIEDVNTIVTKVDSLGGQLESFIAQQEERVVEEQSLNEITGAFIKDVWLVRDSLGDFEKNDDVATASAARNLRKVLDQCGSLFDIKDELEEAKDPQKIEVIQRNLTAKQGDLINNLTTILDEVTAENGIDSKMLKSFSNEINILKKNVRKMHKKGSFKSLIKSLGQAFTSFRRLFSAIKKFQTDLLKVEVKNLRKEIEQSLNDYSKTLTLVEKDALYALHNQKFKYLNYKKDSGKLTELEKKLENIVQPHREFNDLKKDYNQYVAGINNHYSLSPAFSQSTAEAVSRDKLDDLENLYVSTDQKLKDEFKKHPSNELNQSIKEKLIEFEDACSKLSEGLEQYFREINEYEKRLQVSNKQDLNLDDLEEAFKQFDEFYESLQSESVQDLNLDDLEEAFNKFDEFYESQISENRLDSVGVEEEFNKAIEKESLIQDSNYSEMGNFSGGDVTFEFNLQTAESSKKLKGKDIKTLLEEVNKERAQALEQLKENFTLVKNEIHDLDKPRLEKIENRINLLEGRQSSDRISDKKGLFAAMQDLFNQMERLKASSNALHIQDLNREVLQLEKLLDEGKNTLPDDRVNAIRVQIKNLQEAIVDLEKPSPEKTSALVKKLIKKSQSFQKTSLKDIQATLDSVEDLKVHILKLTELSGYQDTINQLQELPFVEDIYADEMGDVISVLQELKQLSGSVEPENLKESKVSLEKLTEELTSKITVLEETCQTYSISQSERLEKLKNTIDQDMESFNEKGFVDLPYAEPLNKHLKALNNSFDTLKKVSEQVKDSKGFELLEQKIEEHKNLQTRFKDKYENDFEDVYDQVFQNFVEDFIDYQSTNSARFKSVWPDEVTTIDEDQIEGPYSVAKEKVDQKRKEIEELIPTLNLYKTCRDELISMTKDKIYSLEQSLKRFEGHPLLKSLEDEDKVLEGYITSLQQNLEALQEIEKEAGSNKKFFANIGSTRSEGAINYNTKVKKIQALNKENIEFFDSIEKLEAKTLQSFLNDIDPNSYSPIISTLPNSLSENEVLNKNLEDLQAEKLRMIEESTVVSELLSNGSITDEVVNQAKKLKEDILVYNSGILSFKKEMKEAFIGEKWTPLQEQVGTYIREKSRYLSDAQIVELQEIVDKDVSDVPIESLDQLLSDNNRVLYNVNLEASDLVGREQDLDQSIGRQLLSLDSLLSTVSEVLSEDDLLVQQLNKLKAALIDQKNALSLSEKVSKNLLEIAKVRNLESQDNIALLSADVKKTIENHFEATKVLSDRIQNAISSQPDLHGEFDNTNLKQTLVAYLVKLNEGSLTAKDLEVLDKESMGIISALDANYEHYKEVVIQEKESFIRDITDWKLNNEKFLTAKQLSDWDSKLKELPAITSPLEIKDEITRLKAEQRIIQESIPEDIDTQLKLVTKQVAQLIQNCSTFVGDAENRVYNSQTLIDTLSKVASILNEVESLQKSIEEAQGVTADVIKEFVDARNSSDQALSTAQGLYQEELSRLQSLEKKLEHDFEILQQEFDGYKFEEKVLQEELNKLKDQFEKFDQERPGAHRKRELDLSTGLVRIEAELLENGSNSLQNLKEQWADFIASYQESFNRIYVEPLKVMAGKVLQNESISDYFTKSEINDLSKIQGYALSLGVKDFRQEAMQLIGEMHQIAAIEDGIKTRKQQHHLLIESLQNEYGPILEEYDKLQPNKYDLNDRENVHDRIGELNQIFKAIQDPKIKQEGLSELINRAEKLSHLLGIDIKVLIQTQGRLVKAHEGLLGRLDSLTVPLKLPGVVLDKNYGQDFKNQIENLKKDIGGAETISFNDIATFEQQVNNLQSEIEYYSADQVQKLYTQVIIPLQKELRLTLKSLKSQPAAESLRDNLLSVFNQLTKIYENAKKDLASYSDSEIDQIKDQVNQLTSTAQNLLANLELKERHQSKYDELNQAEEYQSLLNEIPESIDASGLKNALSQFNQALEKLSGSIGNEEDFDQTLVEANQALSDLELSKEGLFSNISKDFSVKQQELGTYLNENGSMLSPATCDTLEKLINQVIDQNVSVTEQLTQISTLGEALKAAEVETQEIQDQFTQLKAYLDEYKTEIQAYKEACEQIDGYYSEGNYPFVQVNSQLGKLDILYNQVNIPKYSELEGVEKQIEALKKSWNDNEPVRVTKVESFYKQRQIRLENLKKEEIKQEAIAASGYLFLNAVSMQSRIDQAFALANKAVQEKFKNVKDVTGYFLLGGLPPGSLQSKSEEVQTVYQDIQSNLNSMKSIFKAYNGQIVNQINTQTSEEERATIFEDAKGQLDAIWVKGAFENQATNRGIRALTREDIKFNERDLISTYTKIKNLKLDLESNIVKYLKVIKREEWDKINGMSEGHISSDYKQVLYDTYFSDLEIFGQNLNNSSIEGWQQFFMEAVDFPTASSIERRQMQVEARKEARANFKNTIDRGINLIDNSHDLIKLGIAHGYKNEELQVSTTEVYNQLNDKFALVNRDRSLYETNLNEFNSKYSNPLSLEREQARKLWLESEGSFNLMPDTFREKRIALANWHIEDLRPSNEIANQLYDVSVPVAKDLTSLYKSSIEQLSNLVEAYKPRLEQLGMDKELKDLEQYQRRALSRLNAEYHMQNEKERRLDSHIYHLIDKQFNESFENVEELVQLLQDLPNLIGENWKNQFIEGHNKKIIERFSDLDSNNPVHQEAWRKAQGYAFKWNADQSVEQNIAAFESCKQGFKIFNDYFKFEIFSDEQLLNSLSDDLNEKINEVVRTCKMDLSEGAERLLKDLRGKVSELETAWNNVEVQEGVDLSVQKSNFFKMFTEYVLKNEHTDNQRATLRELESEIKGINQKYQTLEAEAKREARNLKIWLDNKSRQIPTPNGKYLFKSFIIGFKECSNRIFVSVAHDAASQVEKFNAVHNKLKAFLESLEDNDQIDFSQFNFDYCFQLGSPINTFSDFLGGAYQLLSKGYGADEPLLSLQFLEDSKAIEGGEYSDLKDAVMDLLTLSASCAFERSFTGNHRFAKSVNANILGFDKKVNEVLENQYSVHIASIKDQPLSVLNALNHKLRPYDISNTITQLQKEYKDELTPYRDPFKSDFEHRLHSAVHSVIEVERGLQESQLTKIQLWIQESLDKKPDLKEKYQSLLEEIIGYLEKIGNRGIFEEKGLKEELAEYINALEGIKNLSLNEFIQDLVSIS